MTKLLLWASLLLALARPKAPIVESFVFNESLNNPLQCPYEENNDLNDDCRILKLYSQAQVEAMEVAEAYDLARHCACKLLTLPWEQAYDDDPSTRQLESMVHGVLEKDTYKSSYPPYLWSDIDVVVNGISIYTSTKDFFQKHRQNASVSPISADEMNKDFVLSIVRKVCRKVARDQYKLYRYLENLDRINSVIFFRVLETSDVINLIYQASKACKLLVVHRLDEFKLRPDNRGFFIVTDNTTWREYYDMETTSNYVNSNNDIDRALSHASVLLMNCHAWQRVKKTIQELNYECPMMMGDSSSIDWIQQNPLMTPSDRSKLAIKCGCQLLLHNNTWNAIMRDKNVQTMSKTLTNYFNQNRLPNFDDAQLWTIHGWFEHIMSRFTNTRKASVKEVIKYLRGSQDPTDAINAKTHDEEEALELLRRGCNYIMFNYNKGSREVSELKLIKYLENLRYISQDPLFVFHLTLQDANLFKLHALSKLCEPIVR